MLTFFCTFLAIYTLGREVKEGFGLVNWCNYYKFPNFDNLKIFKVIHMNIDWDIELAEYFNK